MLFAQVFVSLLIVELLYFKIAERFNIVDKPNERSSHSTVTLRGGGVIFYFAVLLYFFNSGFHYPWFFLGLSLIALISFIDDILTLSNKLRLFMHFISVFFLVYQLDGFDLPWYYLILIFVILVGVINAYNFMDGINGITGIYSLSILGLLSLTNSQLNFTDQKLLLFLLFSLVIFLFFNFRKVAKCFAGDVGSVSIAFILIFLLSQLILKTGNFIFILFLAVYGIDVICTIVNRIFLKQNIFEAHRSHLYQYLGNEAGVSKLLISFLYGFLQLLIGVAVIEISKMTAPIQYLLAIGVLVILIVVYLKIKSWVYKRYVK